ncbi:MAG: hypothetical protein HY082_09395 [Gammaproteobacteria bacterium]|nr:hypothetical protein [Gammaproteobacteria bacterium]
MALRRYGLAASPARPAPTADYSPSVLRTFHGSQRVKMCRTEMKILGIKEEDIPAFIELVPYGPDEEKRLLRNGYIYL